MKNLIIFLVTVFSFQFMIAQEYIKTEKYSIKSIVKTKQQEYGTGSFDLITNEDSSRIIATLNIVELELLTDISVSTLANPNLENIKEVIKIDINYSACCAHTEMHYFLVTNSDEFISLPHLENTYCEHTRSEIQYVFPNQEDGKENTILKTAVSFEDTFTHKKVEVLQSVVWNDDNFLTINDIINVYYDENY